MDKSTASRELLERFIRLVNKYNALEKYPLRYGTPHRFYHSERHLLDIVGSHPHLNITAFARLAGVTKGAISQIASRLEKKGVIRRYKDPKNSKEVLIALTDLGREIYAQHQRINAETVRHLQEELAKYPDEQVAFLLHMFAWLEAYLDQSRARMAAHEQEGHR
ncbi:MAG: MarR family transcriptional regulator [Nitrospinota bacterium]|nr:MAG: MarR family transcriptional regulator [Nitrospinota bacterium]